MDCARLHQARLNEARPDTGSIVIGWLTKLMVVIAIVGVAAFDTISIAAARLGAKDDANTAAEAASADFRTSHNVNSAYQAALETLPSSSETIPAKTFLVQQDGTVTLILDRTTKTLVVQHIGPLKHYTHVVERGVGTPPTP